MTYLLCSLPSFAQTADLITQCDAVAGNIADEPDYMSAWLSTLRMLWRLAGGDGAIQTRALSKGMETIFGSDVLLVLQSDNVAKIVLIECKRLGPKMDRTGVPTQVLQGVHVPPPALVSPISHFSDQLLRQQAMLMQYPALVFLEMFFNFEGPGGAYSPPNFYAPGSSVVQHGIAVGKAIAQGVGKTWTEADVSGLGKSSIYYALNSVVHCHLGETIASSDVPGILSSMGDVAGDSFISSDDTGRLDHSWQKIPKHRRRYMRTVEQAQRLLKSNCIQGFAVLSADRFPFEER